MGKKRKGSKYKYTHIQSSYSWIQSNHLYKKKVYQLNWWKKQQQQNDDHQHHIVVVFGDDDDDGTKMQTFFSFNDKNSMRPSIYYPLDH